MRLHFPFLVKVSVDLHVLISLFPYLNPYVRSSQFEQLVVDSPIHQNSFIPVS
jgi:hypothetical protein